MKIVRQEWEGETLLDGRHVRVSVRAWFDGGEQEAIHQYLDLTLAAAWKRPENWARAELTWCAEQARKHFAAVMKLAKAP